MTKRDVAEAAAAPAAAGPPAVDKATHAFAEHSTGLRVSTDTVIVNALRKQWPELSLVVTPSPMCPLLGFAGSGQATVTPVHDVADPLTTPYSWRMWMPPARRRGGGGGALMDMVLFARYLVRWKGFEFVAYVASGRDGVMGYPQVNNTYLLCADPAPANQLIAECSRWAYELHNEIWVFENGWWSKSAELWQNIQGSEWADVILDEDMKRSIIEDVDDFFASRETYKRLKVPWKRGLIFWGPPGNGKTISIKATMHTLYKKSDPIPTLYVRSLNNFMGPEAAVNLIFSKARQEAPCFLVFEDLDSVVTDQVRSYFLNEVDGLKANDGVLMVGSTNHLDRLDPGLAKRPSRFDRKYLFPDPNKDQRVAYAKFWQKKLSSTPDIDFPDALCPAVAGITHGFSFAYMQEAFVASLLAIARRSGKDSTGQPAPAADTVPVDEVLESPSSELGPGEVVHEYKALMHRLREQHQRFEQMVTQLERKGLALDDSDSPKEPDLDHLPLWEELQKQVATLREGLEDEARAVATARPAAPAPALPLAAAHVPPVAHAHAPQFFPATAGEAMPHRERISQWLQSLGGAAAGGEGAASAPAAQGFVPY